MSIDQAKQLLYLEEIREYGEGYKYEAPAPVVAEEDRAEYVPQHLWNGN